MSDIITERLSFPGAHRGLLDARLERPRGPVRAYALFAHCFTCGKDTVGATRVSKALARRGIATLRFDFTGLGQSEGEFADTNFSSNVEDLRQGVAFLREHYRAPELLIGHSLGGAAVLAAAGEIPEAAAVASIAAPSDPAHVAEHFGDQVCAIEEQGEAEVTLAGREFVIGKHFLDDIERWELPARLRELRKPIMLLHSPVDRVVSIEHARRLFQAAYHPKSFVSLDDADHLLSRRADAEYVAELIAAWAGRYIQAHDTDADTPELGTGQVLVRETRDSRLAQDVFTDAHRLRADEPESVGGTDSGPSPYEYLLAGLGACTAMTLRLYAERKSLALERVTVRLAHDKVHASDCEACETREGKLDKIERHVHLAGELSEDERRRLLEIADKCPVHRTLHSEIWIETEEDA